MTSTSTPAASPEIAAQPPLRRGVALAVGVLGVGAALGAGHLAAGLVSPSSSPFVAVGDVVIRFSPEPLTEFAKTTFGTADKPVLLTGMLVVIALVAAAAGLVSRRTPRPGTAVVVLLGLAGAAAVVYAPTFAPADLVAPATALVAGVGAFRGLHRLARRTAARDAGAPSPSTAGSGGMSRRSVLVGVSAAVGLAAAAAAAGGQLLSGGTQSARAAVTARLRRAPVAERAPAVPAGAAFPQLGTPTFITANPDFYRIDTALRIPTPDPTTWRLRLHGLLTREMSLSFDDLLARPLVERTITMTCVSNPIGGNLVSTATFTGVELRPLLLEAGLSPRSDALYSTSADGWSTSTPTAVLLEPGRGALLAVGMNGEALPPEHGFPVRMVVPGLYGYVSATKWLVDLEATTFADPAAQGYWYQRGWAQRAPIKTMSRIDSPRPFAQVPAGTIAIAGIAWAQHTGIAAVEISVDNGPWQRATLSTEVTIDTWRMWHAAVPLAPGGHTAQVRATDRTGQVQTPMRADPIPDGASGWPSVVFTVV